MDGVMWRRENICPFISLKELSGKDIFAGNTKATGREMHKRTKKTRIQIQKKKKENSVMEFESAIWVFIEVEGLSSYQRNYHVIQGKQQQRHILGRTSLTLATPSWHFFVASDI